MSTLHRSGVRECRQLFLARKLRPVTAAHFATLQPERKRKERAGLWSVYWFSPEDLCPRSPLPYKRMSLTRRPHSVARGAQINHGADWCTLSTSGSVNRSLPDDISSFPIVREVIRRKSMRCKIC